MCNRYSTLIIGVRGFRPRIAPSSIIFAASRYPQNPAQVPSSLPELLRPLGSDQKDSPVVGESRRRVHRLSCPGSPHEDPRVASGGPRGPDGPDSHNLQIFVHAKRKHSVVASSHFFKQIFQSCTNRFVDSEFSHGSNKALSIVPLMLKVTFHFLLISISG
jgi:hypothetical protein